MMKFGHFIEYNEINISLQKSCKKSGGQTSSKPLFVFWKSFISGKSKWSAAYFQNISIALNLAYKIFDFLEKSLGIVSPSHFLYDFQEKSFFWYILWTDNISKNCLIAFACWDIGQYDCNLLLTRLWRHKVWN